MEINKEQNAFDLLIERYQSVQCHLLQNKDLVPSEPVINTKHRDKLWPRFEVSVVFLDDCFQDKQIKLNTVAISQPIFTRLYKKSRQTAR